MSYKLVIAEKPSVAQSIAKVINADNDNIATGCCRFGSRVCDTTGDTNIWKE